MFEGIRQEFMNSQEPKMHLVSTGRLTGARSYVMVIRSRSCLSFQPQRLRKFWNIRLKAHESEDPAGVIVVAEGYRLDPRMNMQRYSGQ